MHPWTAPGPTAAAVVSRTAPVSSAAAVVVFVLHLSHLFCANPYFPLDPPPYLDSYTQDLGDGRSQRVMDVYIYIYGDGRLIKIGDVIRWENSL